MKKKLAVLILSIFLATSTMFPAFAADTDTALPGAGITPDSILYPLDKALESIKLLLTSGDINKAEEILKNAQERLAETQVMIDKEKVELAEKTAEEYSKDLEEAAQKAENAAEKVKDDDTAKKADKSQSTTTATDPMIEKINTFLTDHNATLKDSVKVLADVYSKVSSEQAKQSILTNLVRQTLHAEAVQKFLDAKKAYLEAKKSGAANTDELLNAVKTAKDEMHNVKAQTAEQIAKWNAELNPGSSQTAGTAQKEEDQDKNKNQDKDNQEIKNKVENVGSQIKSEIQAVIEQHKAAIKAKVEDKKTQNQNKTEEKKQEKDQQNSGNQGGRNK